MPNPEEISHEVRKAVFHCSGVRQQAGDEDELTENDRLVLFQIDEVVRSFVRNNTFEGERDDFEIEYGVFTQPLKVRSFRRRLEAALSKFATGDPSPREAWRDYFIAIRWRKRQTSMCDSPNTIANPTLKTHLAEQNDTVRETDGGTVRQQSPDCLFSPEVATVREEIVKAVRRLVERLESPATAVAAAAALDDTIQLYDAFSEALLPRIQATLDALAGRALDSVDKNQKLVRQINTGRAALGASLRLKETGVRVYLKCALSPQSKSATIQIIEAARSRRTLHAGRVFPALEVYIPSE